MIVRHCFTLACVSLCASVLMQHPAVAYDVISSPQVLTGKDAKPVLPPPPLRFHWDSPDQAFWVTGESPPPGEDSSGQLVSASALGSIGTRRRIFQARGISLAVIPTIRTETTWRADDTAVPATADAAILQELAVPLPGGLQLNATGGFGSRIGVSAPNPGGISSDLALRGQAGLSGSLSPIGHRQTRFDLQIIATQALSVDIGETHPSSTCELTLALTRWDIAPLHFSASCPGAAGESSITFKIGGRF
jgi:hypothetical protein